MNDVRTYDREFQRLHQDGSSRSAAVIVPLVQALAPIRSVCDVGCGVGAWLQVWREHGVADVLGIDGAYVHEADLVIPRANFVAADLRQRLRCERRFDLAMSMEVAEHLPLDRALTFIEDLTSLAPLVLFSAAIPGQGGSGHLNEQWQAYWAGRFGDLGFVTLDLVRPQVWEDDRVDFWYRQNALLFCRRDALPNYALLLGTAATPSALPLSVVHPAQLAASLESWKTLSPRQLVTALYRLATGRAGRRISRAWRRP